jgi:hypothetical protein
VSKQKRLPGDSCGEASWLVPSYLDLDRLVKHSIQALDEDRWVFQRHAFE